MHTENPPQNAIECFHIRISAVLIFSEIYEQLISAVHSCDIDQIPQVRRYCLCILVPSHAK